MSGRINPYFKRLIFPAISVLDMLFIIVPYVFRMYMFARRRNIDLIHHNNGFDAAAIILAKLLGRPIVAYQRGVEWNSPIVRFLSKFVIFYIANSKSTKNSLLSIGVNPEKITVIYPPVDFSIFNYQIKCIGQQLEFSVDDSALCFGILGALQKFKGQRVFLKAARNVLSSVPQSKCFIIGDVPDGLLGDISNKLIFNIFFKAIVGFLFFATMLLIIDKEIKNLALKMCLRK